MSANIQIKINAMMRIFSLFILAVHTVSTKSINLTNNASNQFHGKQQEVICRCCCRVNVTRIKIVHCLSSFLCLGRRVSFGKDEEYLYSQFPEPQQSDVVEAIKYGLLSMKQLYEEKEPQLYAMGLYLNEDNPAHFVAAFNKQTVQYKQLSKTAYAAIEATKKFRKKFPALSRQALKNTILNTLEQTCPQRDSPLCPRASRKYRTSDGSCNNLKELWWGSAMSTMQRFLPAVYDDGIESIRKSVTGHDLPSARQVSDTIHKERDVPLESITHMLMQWGQFIDHDVTATGQSRAFNGSVPQCCLKNGKGFQPPALAHPDCLPIAVHPEDSHLGKKGVRCLEFVRSGPAPQEDCQFGPREQLSQVTSFIDVSTIYSSSPQQSDSIRIFRNGLIRYGKLQSRSVAPPEHSDICSQGSLSTGCFRAGDGRVSEQPALISLHVVFVRLHNHLAKKLSAMNPDWSDEKIFQECRKIVGAIVQHITYHEFLPIVLGQKVIKTFDLELARKGYYTGYDASVNPNIANAFSTAAYRFGHSLVQGSFVRFDQKHCPLLNNVSIHEEFANPMNLETAGSVDRMLLGLINQPSQKRDEFISEELTNHLFQTPGFSFGMDLAALNIQRGRDHGLAPFVEWRKACALNRIKDWTDLERIMSVETVEKFKSIYAAVEDIDLFPAGLAEKPLNDGLVGPTFACIIAQQFRHLRKGDRFWYENSFPESNFNLEQLTEIRKITLAQILCSTVDSIDDIQPFVMLRADQLKNQRLRCEDPLLSFINLNPWYEKKVTFTLQRRNAQMPLSSLRTRTPDKPNKTRINQQNRVTVKRPLGPHENLTIVITNNAVYSPVFVKDSIYNSHQNGDRFMHITAEPPLFVPSQDETESLTFTDYETRAKTKQKSSTTYYPQNFGNSHNPNSPSYTFSDSSGWLRQFLANSHFNATQRVGHLDSQNDSEARVHNDNHTTVDRDWDWNLEMPLPMSVDG